MTTAVSSVSDSTILQNYINSQATAAKASAATTSSTSGTTASTTATAISSVTGNFNTFLNILTTQLKNQDPTSATDPNQFTQELVQFSGVEQQINTNSKLDQLISVNSPNGVTPLLSYVGKTIEAPATNNQIVLQNGSAQFAYTLPSTASNVTLTMQDSTGTTVATMNGPTATGLDRVVWNGSTATGTAADGVYTLNVAATDSSGKALTVSDVRLIGTVTSVQTDSSNATTLYVGGASVKASTVDAVFGATSSSSSNGSSSSTTG